MNVREKLVELLREAPYNIFGNKLGNCYFDSCLELIADHLIAHGVTVQEHGWIKIYAGSMYPYSCSKCGNCHARMVKFCECCGTKLDLPQPPKGE